MGITDKIFKKKVKLNGYENVLLKDYPSNSRYAEAYRSLRTNISFSTADHDCRSLLITSAGPKEGKTSTAINLAHALCSTGKSVLLVDADLRNPVMSQLFPGASSPGLTGLVSKTFAAPINKGSIRKYSPSDLIRLFEFQRADGSLHLESGGETFDLAFRNGKMVDLLWPSRPNERKLIQSLVSAETLTRDQARAALNQHKISGNRTGEILIAAGMIQRENLVDILSAQMLDAMKSLLQLQSGSFLFTPVDPVSQAAPDFNPLDYRDIYHKAVVDAERMPFIASEIRNAVVDTQVQDLYVMPAGGSPPNPAELLASKRVPFLLRHLMAQFDMLIIDTPPLLPASDSLLLAPLTDGVLLVVKSGLLNRRLVAGTVEQIKTAKANLLGVVLNQIDTREGYYRYYHYKYYSDYYGKKK